MWSMMSGGGGLQGLPLGKGLAGEFPQSHHLAPVGGDDGKPPPCLCQTYTA